MKYITREDIAQEPDTETMRVDECYSIDGVWLKHTGTEINLLNVKEIEFNGQYKHRLFLVDHDDLLQLWRCVR